MLLKPGGQVEYSANEDIIMISCMRLLFICSQELKWSFEEGGAALIFPEAWEPFWNYIPQVCQWFGFVATLLSTFMNSSIHSNLF